jgi:hypothetical protein
MQTRDYNIITPWDSVCQVHDWSNNTHTEYCEVVQPVVYFGIEEEYIDSAILYLFYYILFLGFVNILRYGKIHRKNKTVEGGQPGVV